MKNIVKQCFKMVYWKLAILLYPIIIIGSLCGIFIDKLPLWFILVFVIGVEICHILVSIALILHAITSKK